MSKSNHASSVTEKAAWRMAAFFHHAWSDANLLLPCARVVRALEYLFFDQCNFERNDKLVKSGSIELVIWSSCFYLPHSQ